MAVERKFERDIDLMLAEELSVNSDFARWLISRTRFANRDSLVVDDVWVSVGDNAGESDLVVRFKDQNNSDAVAVYIEDKIDAGFMKDQEKRYRIRAEVQKSAGLFQDYVIILCAPRSYLATKPEAAHFDHQISYEDIAAFLRAEDSSRRMIYRANFIETAAVKSKNKWNRIDDPATNAFWAAAHQIAQAEFPELQMKLPNFTKGSAWLTLTPDLLKGIKGAQIMIKGPKGVVDLSFMKTSDHPLSSLIAALLPSDMSVIKTDESSVIRLYARSFTITEDLALGMSIIRENFKAAKRLLEFYASHRAEIGDAVYKSRISADP